MSVVIDADRERVWRALTMPSELIAWDERILSPIDEPGQYPFAGQHVRWRYRLGSVQVACKAAFRDSVLLENIARRDRTSALVLA